MVMDDKVKNHILITSFAIATVLFLVGFGLGFAFDYFRTAEVNNLVTENQLNMESFLMQQQLLAQTTMDVTSCSLLKSRFVDLQNERTKIGRKLEDYERKALASKELDYLKRKHVILGVSSLLVLDDLKQNCGYADLDTIIFFYAVDSSQSTRQGLILDEAYNRFPDTLSIFAFDKNFEEEPLITFLKAKYGVTSAPTIIINGEKREGLVELQEILSLL